MKKLFLFFILFSLNSLAGFDDIGLIPNLDLVTIKTELVEKGCE